MKEVRSSYKIFGGFGLLLVLNTLFIFVFVKAGLHKGVHFSDGRSTYGIRPEIFLFCAGAELMALILFATQCRYVIADTDGITFINPILPFLKRRKTWADFTIYGTVMEYSQNGSYEAVWLLKDDKLVARFSSFYYSNYEELKGAIQTPYKGELKLSRFKHLSYMLGCRIKRMD
jgi:hypothetical protein